MVIKRLKSSNYKIESFGIMGLVFGVAALAKIIVLEKKLKESGLLKEETKSNEK
jgi:hypothetical protein